MHDKETIRTQAAEIRHLRVLNNTLELQISELRSTIDKLAERAARAERDDVEAKMQLRAVGHILRGEGKQPGRRDE